MSESPQRVLVYGVCGSGKTTLARRLAERSGLPLEAIAVGPTPRPELSDSPNGTGVSEVRPPVVSSPTWNARTRRRRRHWPR